ncbi:tetratricopeptide repeat protein [Lachnoclostridium sp. Marseille-P6806]|uniref:tetratricopeptide repeat protein n=1 Tax=Lachnoclostridium sp. Marseille-P6806 TaxID=2364793 RepID=UPI0010326EC2|nr:tetratricopeptide repeat protein [Lachnoclostridium sp. Marseille-P6806]
MFCYHCGAGLNERDFCPSCGADVKVYKRVLSASNRFFNEGLDRAKLHDLSGAVTSLRQSVRLYKYNVDARNVLGLVYLELGETSAALSEWVISESIEKEHNPASKYIGDLNTNRNRMENLRQAIRKYNRALDYCRQGSYDLAVIQLKKVLQLNPKYLRARQLLALLYLSGNELGRAGKQLKKCKAQDPNNTTTLRYMKELSEQTLPEDQGAQRASELAEGVIRFQDGNETVIMPAGSAGTPVEFGGNPLTVTLINIGIGLLVGAAVVGLFVLPARVSRVRSEAAEQYRAVSEELDTQTASASEQQRRLEDLTAEKTSLEERLAAYESSSGTLSSNDALFRAASLCLANPEDVDGIGAALESVDSEALGEASEEYRALYDRVLSGVRTPLVEKYYTEGYDAYTDDDYEMAVKQLGFAVRYTAEQDETYDDILYYYADAIYLRFRGMESEEQSANADVLSEAQKYFNMVKELEDSEYAADAETRIQEISLLKSQLAASASRSGETAPGTASGSSAARSASGEEPAGEEESASGTEQNPDSADRAGEQSASSTEEEDGAQAADTAAEQAAAEEAEQKAAALAAADAALAQAEANLAAAQQGGDAAVIAAAQAAYDAAAAQRSALN